MVIEKINRCLAEEGFHSVEVNVKNIYLHYVVLGQEVYLVALLDCKMGTEFSPDQYRHIREQIYNKFRDLPQRTIRFLTVLCTDDVNSARNLISEGEQWILDTANYKLILYENQTGDFLDLKQKIEKILSKAAPAQEWQERDKDSMQEQSYGKSLRKPFRPFYFSKCNTTIVILNVLVFLLVYIGGTSSSETLLDAGALNWRAVFEYKQYYRLFTYMFLHYGLQHLVNNMIVLLVIGDNLERAMGKWKYTLTYFVSGVIAAAVSLSYNMLIHTESVSVGASGAIFGVVGAMAYIVVVNKGRLEDLSSWQLILFVFVSLYGGLTSQGIDNAAHIGGLAAGAVTAAILYRKPKRDKIEGSV